MRREPPRGRMAAAARALLTLLALCLPALLLGPTGCGRGKEKAGQDVSRLQITRYRYNIDEAHETARVMAEITNFGKEPVDSIPVTAILRGPDGSARGQNTVTLERLKPGEARVFSVSITTHGRERDVDFQIGEPPENEAAEGNAAAEGSNESG